MERRPNPRSRPLSSNCRWLPALCAVLAMAPAGAAELDLGGGVTLPLVEVAAGQVTLGSPADEPGHGADEAQRTIVITRPFLIGVTPVTSKVSTMPVKRVVE